MSGWPLTRAHLGRLTAAAMLGAATLLAVGCFPIADIDRTQPNKVHKSIFDSEHEWFFRQTVIDVPATSAVSFIGEQGETERVVWDIQENYLFAYRAYPWQEGGDGHVRPGTGPFRDNPVAAFRISKHFDVKRQYNPSTGEQTNVIEENASDRPWYEREWMRVDWSKNLISDFQFGAAAVKQQPVDFYHGEDTTHPTLDAVQITDEYIDVVHVVTAEPEVNDLYTRYFGFPILECWLYWNIHQDCLGAQIKIRSSFLRAPKQSDYLPLEYDDNRFAKFGYFRAERYGYNPEYGVIEPAAIRLANRFNLWENAAECYDPSAEKPYADCSPNQLRTIVYYLNSDFPEEYKSFALDNGEEWDRVFRAAVLAGTGWSESELGNQRLFTICPNNPVKAGDPEECGKPGLSPQMGDLRYSMYYYVPDAQEWSPLGYGPSAQDPLTGETIQGNAFYYGAAGKFIAARTRDILKLELGLLEEDEITGGITAQRAVERLRERESQRFRQITERFDQEKVRDFVDRIDLRGKADRLRHQIRTGEAFMDMVPGRLEKLTQTGIDEMLMTPEMQKLVQSLGVSGQLAGGAVDYMGMHDMSKLLSPELFRLSRFRETRLLNPRAGGCILTGEEFFDTGLVGMLQHIRRRFYDTTQEPPVLRDGFTDDDVYHYIVGRTMADTQLHEIGHTVGLRHNFAGSTDALNFGPEFWRLRGPGYTMAQGDPRPKAMWELSGAYLDGYEQALREGLMDWQDSSVMDYASTYGTNDTLGMYDEAAIKYAYADVVEIFNAPEMDQQRASLLRPGELHYTFYPEAVSNAASYEDRIAAMYDRRTVNWRMTDPESDLYDDTLVEVPYVFCSDEYRDASAICATWDAGLDNFERTLKKAQDYRSYHIFDAFKRERVGFGVDTFGYLNRVYGRSFTYVLNQYKNWVNDELIIRRDRPCIWYENGQRQVNDDRFQDPACGLAGLLGAAEAANFFGEIIQTPDIGCYARLENGCYLVEPSNEDGIDGTPVVLVDTDPNACDGLQPQVDDPDTEEEEPNLVPLKITTTSEYVHVRDSTTCAGWQPILDIGDPRDPNDDIVVSREPIELDYGDARPSITLYDRQKYGYYFYWKPVVMGSWWDKWLAVKALGDPWTDFIGVDASSDTRSYLISLNTIFANEIHSMIGGIVADRANRYAPRLGADGKLETLPMIDLYSADSPWDTNTRPLVDPDQQYTFRLLAMFNMAFQSQMTDDLEFSETIMVGRRYANTSADLPDEIKNDPTRYAEFRDPETGFLYFAVNTHRDGEAGSVYNAGYEFIRTIKDRYFEGGADGPGLVPLEGFAGWQLQSDIRILEIMRETREKFGRADVWEGDF